mgnify:CR=1 FL=1
MHKIQMTGLLTVVIAIGMLHFFTPGDMGLYHDAYRRLSYFPIVLGGIWFGLRGGILIAVLSSIAFIPHLLLYIGQDPSIYLSELTEIILYLAAGVVTGLIAGREKKLREKYRILSEKLEKSYAKLHEDSATLIELEEQLSASQKLSALGQLSASLAHEIKNPLSSIKGTAEILLEEFSEEHPKREFGEILIREVDRLNVTVNEVLQFSRGREVTGNDQPAEQLAEVLARVGRLLENFIRKKRISFSVQLDPEAETFRTESSRMTQVFLNLVLNAIDAVAEEGIIEVAVAKEKNGIQATIADNGPGIPEDERDKVFKPFYTDKEEGTGLGLSISSKIVESLGGSMTVGTSRYGGAAFIIFLPSAEDPPDLNEKGQ